MRQFRHYTDIDAVPVRERQVGDYEYRVQSDKVRLNGVLGYVRQPRAEWDDESRQYVQRRVFLPCRKEGWMRHAIRRTILLMVAAALIALAIAIGIGGQYELVARVLVAAEISLIAAAMLFVAFD